LICPDGDCVLPGYCISVASSAAGFEKPVPGSETIL
jgi:hypothetical protein